MGRSKPSQYVGIVLVIKGSSGKLRIRKEITRKTIALRWCMAVVQVCAYFVLPKAAIVGRQSIHVANYDWLPIPRHIKRPRTLPVEGPKRLQGKILVDTECRRLLHNAILLRGGKRTRHHLMRARATFSSRV